MPTTTTFALMRLCVAILKSGAGGLTDAGQRIYTPADWPTWDQQYPYVRARVQTEDKQSLGRSAPRFTVTGAIKFAIYAAEGAVVDDGSAAVLDQALQAIARQIETALINNPLLMGQVQQFPFMHLRDVYDASGAQHYGAIEQLLGVEFYQGDDDFFQQDLVPFTGVFLAADLKNIFDPTGVYEPSFDYPVTDPPRTEGPDGRPEAGLMIGLGEGVLDFSDPDNSGLLAGL